MAVSVQHASTMEPEHLSDLLGDAHIEKRLEFLR